MLALILSLTILSFHFAGNALSIYSCQSLSPSPAQDSNAQKRTEEILVLFNKRKYIVKEKYGIRKERYKEIRSLPVVKPPKDYLGMYEVTGSDAFLRLQIGQDGSVEASGSEPMGTDCVTRKFTLHDARIVGALLSATKVYEGGETAKFEGVFINMTDIEGVSPTQVEHSATSFGIGVTGVRFENNGVDSDKLFYQLKR